MSNILENIVAHKFKEVAARKQQISIADLEAMPLFNKSCNSLTKNLRQSDTTGIIAEFKRQSPSKGIINATASVTEVTHAYAQFGAAGISVLTDTRFFGGSLKDLTIAIQQSVPVLRKEFIIDEFQIMEAKAYGASVILLIAACLTPAEVKLFAGTAHKLGMEVLLELHDKKELEYICPGIDMVGINNRSLKSFEVTIEHSLQLKDSLPSDILSIAESGIYDITTYRLLKREGFDGFLMGEYFMKQSSPAAAFETFSQQIKKDHHAS
jgi:indole-3-glycerol phosphate synthase